MTTSDTLHANKGQRRTFIRWLRRYTVFSRKIVNSYRVVCEAERERGYFLLCNIYSILLKVEVYYDYYNSILLIVYTN